MRRPQKREVREAFLEEVGGGFTEAGVLLGGGGSLRPLQMPWLTPPTFPTGLVFQVWAMGPQKPLEPYQHQSPPGLAP